MTVFPWATTKDGCEIRVRLTPKAAHTRIQGLYFDGNGQSFLKISVVEPPIDGLANEGLIEFLAKKLHCSKTSITLLRGKTDRYKTLLISDQNEKKLQESFLP